MTLFKKRLVRKPFLVFTIAMCVSVVGVLPLRNVFSGNKNVTLFVPQIHCASCQRRVQTELKKVPGVVSINIDFNSKKVSLVTQHQVSAAELEEAMRRTGYAIAKIDGI